MHVVYSYMNYKESKEILKEIKRAKKVLINCHRGPDPDAIGSALALFYVFEKMGKKVDVVCPSKKLYEGVFFLKSYEKIKRSVNFSSLKYSDYDLFFALDSSDWGMVTSDKNIPTPSIPIIVIDHHNTNDMYGNINLVDKKASSVGEVVFRMFKDWEVKLDKDISTALLTAIIGDTGLFRYPNSTDKTYEAVQELLKNGAEKELIISNLYRNNDINLVKFWGEVLSRVEEDVEHRFVYCAIPYEVYMKYAKPDNAKESACDLFAQSTRDTDFGFMALESEKNTFSISFRARNEFDTSQIAVALGGGGHKAASGAKVTGKSFRDALDLTLRMARKYAKKYKQTT